MELLKKLLDIVLHLDTHLNDLVKEYGVWVYLILFIIIFCETGLIVTPFLPGDSLLFAVGAIAAVENSALNVFAISGLLLAAAILGNTVNYSVGRFAGHKLLARFPRLIRPEHMAKTHAFFERYGGKTIVITRFVPIVRTLAPFVAGVGEMSYPRFMWYNVMGGALWILLLIPAGYFFGNIPIIKRNFSAVILLIVFVSILPAIIEFWRERRRMKAGA
jgi:membrane-associated protein